MFLIELIKWSIIYFVLIFLIHQLYLFFQKNFTNTKTKDFFYTPINEYSKIDNIINNSNNNSNSNNNFNNNSNNNSNSNGNNDFNFDNNNMTNELNDFLEKLNN